MESFTSAIQTLIRTNKDFPFKFKQYLFHESHKVRNPLKFIVGLITEGVLSDGRSSDTAASLDLKGAIVELAMWTVCSKGADAIGGFTKALEVSGNFQLISAIRTWIKEDFATEIEGDLSDAKGAAAVQTGTSKRSANQQVRNSVELQSNAAMLTDKIVSRMEDDFLEQLEGHWVGKTSRIVNVPEFGSILAQQKVLNESDLQLTTGMESKQDQWAQKAIKAALSKKAIASLVFAFQLSGNEWILQETKKWLETSQVGNKNSPVSVKPVPPPRKHQKPKLAMSHFFEQAAPFNQLQKVATFNCSPESFTEGESALKFGEKKMVACFSGGSMRQWNWRKNEETTIKFGDKVKGLTAFQYDGEILVLGTAAGTVHLFDAKTLEETCSDGLGEPVHSLKMGRSTLVVATRHGNEDKLWWLEISRSDMQLRNRMRRPMLTLSQSTNYGFLIDENYTFVYNSNVASIHHSDSGESVREYGGLCSLDAPAVITTLSVVYLIGGTRFVVAGCENSVIAIWKRQGPLGPEQKPAKTLHGHQEAIVCLSAINGHLLSVCEGGKLLMWSGHNLKNQHIESIPRVLAENFHNVTSLVEFERWLASASSEDSTINIWALPDLWLCSG